MKNREEFFMRESQQLHQYVTNLSDEKDKEKEEMVREHTLQTAELRKKNSFLKEEVHRLENLSMSAQPSSTEYSSAFPEFEKLTMDSGPFDDFVYTDSTMIDSQQKFEDSLPDLPKQEKPVLKEEDKSATSGLLLMLLLCGAWVASNSTTRTPTAIPRMPEDVQIASAAVLDNIYKDAGLEPLPTQKPSSDGDRMLQSGSLRRPPYPTMSPSPSPLARLHHDLTTPNDHQQVDQLFSLSAVEYNQITSDDFSDASAEPKKRSRTSSLADALATMRSNKPGSAAEIYTNSLLVDQVPTDVMKAFARMVAESRGG